MFDHQLLCIVLETMLRQSFTEDAVFELGKGAFSSVHCHRRGGDNPYELVAVKKYIRKTAHDRADRILQEKSVMLRLSSETYCDSKLSPYIVKLIDTSKDEAALYFIMEPVLGGPLHKHILQSATSSFHISITKGYIVEIISALRFMARYGVAHRDIKASNILLHSNGHLKICDFGSAKILYDKTEYTTILEMGYSAAPKTYTFIGSTPYMAPEIVECKKANEKGCALVGYNSMADWWSVGILAFEMLYGILASDVDFTANTRVSESFLDTLLSHKDINISDLDKNCDEFFCLDFIRQCLCYEVTNRIGTFKDISLLNHPFFSNITWDDVDNCLTIGNIDFDRRIGYLDFTAVNQDDCKITDAEQGLFEDF